MSIMIDLSLELTQELARQAGKQGVGLDAYALDLLEQAVAEPDSGSRKPSAEVQEAIRQLRDIGKSRGLTLDGMTIGELRHEARP
jgi:hypothetical protein